MDRSTIEKTLFISDLDGTMFDKTPVLSDECIRHIRTLNEAGVRLTFSTARTYRTVDRILKDVPTPIPVSLMNGAMIRDLNNGQNRVVHRIGREVSEKMKELFLRIGFLPLVYRVKGNEMMTYYTELATDEMKEFVRERREEFNKPFIHVGAEELLSPDPEPLGDIMYYCAMTDGDKAGAVYDELSTVEGIIASAYNDNSKDVWYVEAFSPDASKKNAVRCLKKLTGAETVVSFGDNRNDLPMFEVSDLCFSPINAKEEVLSRADGAVDVPGKCGVTRKIAEMCGVEL